MLRGSSKEYLPLIMRPMGCSRQARRLNSLNSLNSPPTDDKAWHSAGPSWSPRKGEQALPAVRYAAVNSSFQDDAARLDLIAATYQRASHAGWKYRLSRMRNKNCEPDRAFPVLAQTSMVAPSAHAWERLIGDVHTCLIGDSVLRDLYVQLLRSNIGVLNMTNPRHLGFDPHFYRANASFVGRRGSLSFLWARENPARTTVRLVAASELVVFHLGAHHLEPAQLRDTVSSWWRLALGSVAARGRLAWLQYARPHFPWGLGEFEDVYGVPGEPGSVAPHASYAAINHSLLWSRIRAAAPDDWNVCRPGPATSGTEGGAISRFSLHRLAVDGFFEHHGVPIVRTWEITSPLFNNHPPCKLPDGVDMRRRNGCRAGTVYDFGTPDCRHWCSPGLALHLEEASLFHVFSNML